MDRLADDVEKELAGVIFPSLQGIQAATNERVWSASFHVGYACAAPVLSINLVRDPEHISLTNAC